MLQGTWYRISSEINGHKVFVQNDWPIPAASSRFMIVLENDGWYGLGRDGKALVKNHVIKLDPTRRPKTIDLYYLDRHGKPRDRATIPGIYKLEGDILTFRGRATAERRRDSIGRRPQVHEGSA